jgi:hypothetical protein
MVGAAVFSASMAGEVLAILFQPETSGDYSM